MAVSTEHTKDILMGDGVNTKFPFTFQVIEKAQIHCLKVLASGEEIELLNTEFEIKLNDNGGGEVTYPLVGEPLAEGCKFIIYRKTEIKQDYTPANSTTFSAESIKNEIDRLTMQNQEQEESLERCVQTTMGSEADPSEYLENVNEMLANARELQEKAVADSQQNIADAKKQVDIATEKAADAALSKKMQQNPHKVPLMPLMGLMHMSWKKRPSLTLMLKKRQRLLTITRTSSRRQ